MIVGSEREGFEVTRTAIVLSSSGASIFILYYIIIKPSSLNFSWQSKCLIERFNGKDLIINSLATIGLKARLTIPPGGGEKNICLFIINFYG